jgi:DNA-binding transcriptional ArsR family regulator
MKPLPLWRVSRVLANRPRLKLLGLISRRPGLRVGELARAVKLSKPAASQYLSALEACGFVISHRAGRSVMYEVAAIPSVRALVKALTSRLCDKNSIEAVFKLSTAFANPGRIDVFRSLSAGPKSLAELNSSTGFPRSTLWRHLQKLRAREWCAQQLTVKSVKSSKGSRPQTSSLVL